MPTAFGKEVKQELDKNFKKIMNVKFTAEMENSLDEVANGKLNWIELLKSFYEKLEIEMKKYKEIQEDIKNKIIYTDMPCSDGNGKMLLKTGNFGKYLVCEFNSKDKISISGIEINDDDIKNDFVEIKDKVEVLLENKKGYKTDVFTENGKMYLLKNGRFGEYLESEDYENDNLRKPLSKEIRAKLKKSSIAVENGILKLNDILQENQNKDNEILENAGKCEKCGRDFVIKTGRYGKFLACSGYPECSNIKRISKMATTKTKRKTTSTKKK